MKKSPLILSLINLCLVAAMHSLAEDNVVAWVNKRPITERQVTARMEPVLDRFGLKPGSAKYKQLLPQIRKKALQLLIDRAVALTSSEADRIDITEGALNTRIVDLMKSEGIDKIQLEARMGSQWRDEIRDTMIIDRIKQDLAKSCPPCSKSEAAALYRKDPRRFMSNPRVKVSTIFLDQDKINDPNIRRYATGICNRVIEAGEEEWNLAVTEFSSGPKAETGGYWDWIEPSRLPGTLGAEALRCHPGEIVKVPHGNDYYILRLDEVEERTQLSFVEARERIEAEIMRRKAAEAWRAWINTQRGKARIK